MPLLFNEPPTAKPSNENFITLEGVLKRVLYFNEENAYTIGMLFLPKEKRTVTITGNLPSVQCGETLVVKGEWGNHTQYGEQFQVHQFESRLPSDVHGIRQYLGSGLVYGVGKVYAAKIVEYFGKDTFKVLSQESARLLDVPGIGKTRAKSIKKAWDEQQSVREVMIFLQTYGFSTTQCLRLVRRYGSETKRLIQENPYRMINDVDGIGFRSADKVALNLGFANDSIFRVDSGIEYCLQESESDGNTGAYKKQLVSEAAQLLGVESGKVEDRLKILLEEGQLSDWPSQGCVQRVKMAITEAVITKYIKRLKNAYHTLPPIQIEKALEWSEQKLKIQWAEAQKTALKCVLESKLSILTGGPGTGKTTLLRAIVEVLKAKKVRLMLAAPTGRAAQRMSEATGYPAKTVHRTLKYEPTIGRFVFNANNPLPVDFLIVDEASMLDIFLMASLLEALPETAHILLVGDVHQLPSVGPGNVLNDFIKSGLWSVHYLHDVFRQAERSKIVTVAHEILNGQTKLKDVKVLNEFGPTPPEEDLHFVYIDDPEKCLDAVEKLCWEFLPNWYKIDPIRDVQILVPMHKGLVGIERINDHFQKHLGTQRRALTVGQQTFYKGDKVIQLKNNYEKNIFNGDLGFVYDINTEDSQLLVEFGSEIITLERFEVLDLKPAYAVSIHKSQGSEFPIVVIPLLKQHFVLLKRNLIYTAVTRGRKKVFMVGDPKAYSIAVRTQDSSIRLTTLGERLLNC